MILLIVFLTALFVVCAVGVMAAHSDIRGMTIPNSYSLIVIAIFVVCYGVLWIGGREDVFSPILSHGLSGLFVFLVTLAMFAAKAIGAGDAKLASAFALWVGLKGLMAFLFYMSVTGGLLGLMALALKKWTPVKEPKPESWIARVQAGESKVPYGVAIVVGALASFLKIGYFNGEVLSSFILK